MLRGEVEVSMRHKNSQCPEKAEALSRKRPQASAFRWTIGHRLWVKFREVTFTALLATIWCGEKSTINTITMGDGDEEKMTQSMSL